MGDELEGATSDGIRATSEVDVHIGSRVKQRRVQLDISQQKLSDAIGVTFQQLQKYESGQNRISASRLFQLSKSLEVPISYFFEGLSRAAAPSEHRADLATLFSTRDGISLADAFLRIESAAARRAVVKLAASVADSKKKRETGKSD